MHIFHISFQSESPAGTELNALGVYLLVSLFFVVAAMIEFAVALVLQRMWHHKENPNPTNIERTPMPQKWLAKGNNIASNWIDEQGNEKLTLGMQTAKKRTGLNFSTNKIDIAAFVISFMLYIFFNCVYWSEL